MSRTCYGLIAFSRVNGRWEFWNGGVMRDHGTKEDLEARHGLADVHDDRMTPRLLLESE